MHAPAHRRTPHATVEPVVARVRRASTARRRESGTRDRIRTTRAAPPHLRDPASGHTTSTQAACSSRPSGAELASLGGSETSMEMRASVRSALELSSSSRARAATSRNSTTVRWSSARTCAPARRHRDATRHHQRARDWGQGKEVLRGVVQGWRVPCVGCSCACVHALPP